jgi:hypothetical protein
MCSRWSRSSSCCSSGVSIGGLLLKGARQLDDLSGEPPLAGLQSSPFGVGEAGEVERQQLVEGPLGLIEARLELARRGAQGRDRRRAGGGHGAAGIAHKRLAGRHVAGRAPGGEEGLGLPRAHPMAREGIGDTRLIPAREHGDGGGRGGREAAGIDLRGDVRCEPAAEGQAAVHPAPAAAEQLGNLGGREVIVVGERADHAGLIHGAQGPPRGVRLEQARLGDDAGGVFHDHGHVGVAGAGPAGEALEAVKHFVGTVARRRDTQGQRGEGAGGIGARPPQRRQRGGEPIERDLEHEAHGWGGSRGRSWESG